MQGVRVSGLLIWSPFREGDGPAKLFKAFGNDLKRKNSPNIGVKIGNIARSIIRDKIANMTIDDVLKNRAALRDAIKKDIQVLLTGWGMWLETIEVSDVQICSATLFGNMQAEFKEENRLRAQQITAASEDKIRRAKLGSDIDYKIESQKQKVVLDKRTEQLAAEQEMFSLQNKTRQQTEYQRLLKAEHATTFSSEKNRLALEKEQQEKKLELRKAELKLEDEMINPKTL